MLEVFPSALGLFPWQNAVLSLTCGEEDRQEPCRAAELCWDAPRLSVLLTRPISHVGSLRFFLWQCTAEYLINGLQAGTKRGCVTPLALHWGQ